MQGGSGRGWGGGVGVLESKKEFTKAVCLV